MMGKDKYCFLDVAKRSDVTTTEAAMATFNDINPQLKAYLLKHRLPDIFEVCCLMPTWA